MPKIELKPMIAEFCENTDVVRFQTKIDGVMYYGMLTPSLETMDSVLENGYNYRASVAVIKPLEKPVKTDE